MAEGDQGKMVPESQLMALKAKLEKAESENQNLMSQLETAQKQAQYGPSGDAERNKSVQDSLASKAIEVSQKEKELAEREKTHRENVFNFEKGKIMSQYKLTDEDVSGITDLKDVEIAGLRKQAAQAPTTTQNLTTEQPKPKATGGDLDGGSRSSGDGDGSMPNMDRAKAMIEKAIGNSTQFRQ